MLLHHNIIIDFEHDDYSKATKFEDSKYVILSKCDDRENIKDVLTVVAEDIFDHARISFVGMLSLSNEELVKKSFEVCFSKLLEKKKIEKVKEYKKYKVKLFILSVPDEIYNRYLEDFIINKLKMEFNGTGCGTTEYQSKTKPRKMKEKILKNFGVCTWNNINFRKSEY